jgi:hypothetical protein
MKTVLLLIIDSILIGIVLTFIYRQLKKRKITRRDLFIIGFTMITLSLLVTTYELTNKLVKPQQNTCSAFENVDKTSLLLDAIAEYESGGDTMAINKEGSSASGHLQILKILVDDANKIVGEKRFTYADRFSRAKAEEIFDIIQNKYNPERDIETAIRLWNGGCGYSREATQKYYEDVMKIFNRKRDEAVYNTVQRIQSLNL